jgi:hypothetical protein
MGFLKTFGVNKSEIEAGCTLSRMFSGQALGDSLRASRRVPAGTVAPGAIRSVISGDDREPRAHGKASG